jgi:hypothetical protein
MGRALCDFANGKLRAYIDGGFEFVAARDIVEGHILAMEKGRTAEKYVFATQFMTLPEMMDMWSEITGQPRPTLKLPAPLMGAIAEVLSPLLTKFAPNFPQRLTPGAVRILQLRRHADLTKSKTELGYKPSSVRAACSEAYEFFARRGAILAPNPQRIVDWAQAVTAQRLAPPKRRRTAAVSRRAAPAPLRTNAAPEPPLLSAPSKPGLFSLNWPHHRDRT